MPTFEYTVDDEPFSTTEHILTPRFILTENAKKDVTLFYLVLRTGNATHSYKDTLDEPIHMHEKMTFYTNAIGPTPVS
jgi:hypothetical protein